MTTEHDIDLSAARYGQYETRADPLSRMAYVMRRLAKSFSKAFSLFSQHISIPGGETIGRRSAPIQLIVHYPKTEEGRQELARRAASVHADAVNRKLQKLTCPTQQKRQLLDAVIQAAREEAMPQSL